MNRFVIPLCGWMAFVVALVNDTGARADSIWPQFRGPRADGTITTDVPTRLSADAAVWRTEIVGKGWSSPVVADQEVWITTAVEIPADEKESSGRLTEADAADRRSPSRSKATAIELRLVGVDFENGKIVHNILLDHFETPDAIHSLNSYASPTPVVDGNLVLAAFGNYGTFAVDRRDGHVVWRHRTPVSHAVGPGSSPIVDGDRLIVIHDGTERQRVIALDKHRGDLVWQTDRPVMDAADGDQKKAYCTPLKIVDPDDREQLLCMASQWMQSLDPRTGEEIWRCRHGRGFSVVPHPVYADGVVYFATGYGKPELWAVEVSGRGDVSQTHVRWRIKRGVSHKPSPLLADDRLYVLADAGVLQAVAINDGRTIWKLRLRGNYSASPVIADGKIYCCSQEGKVHVVIDDGGEGRIVAESELDERIMASPAGVDSSLVLRTEPALYRFANQ